MKITILLLAFPLATFAGSPPVPVKNRNPVAEFDNPVGLVEVESQPISGPEPFIRGIVRPGSDFKQPHSVYRWSDAREQWIYSRSLGTGNPTFSGRNYGRNRYTPRIRY